MRARPGLPTRDRGQGHAASRRKGPADAVHRISRQLQTLLARDRPPLAPGAKPTEAPRAAAQARLHYVSDDRPGITREGKPGRFRYLKRGRPVSDEATLVRIRGLGIPPAWTDVWIGTDPRGHLQATGRDARGRKQYRYHPRWRAVRDQSKFGRMIDFARALPRIRAQVARHLRGPDLSRDKVLAGIVRLLEVTCIRIGNDEYARSNRHYGITTFEDRHAQIAGTKVTFRFRGKSGKDHDIALADPMLARLVRRCRDLPGQRLFQYVDGEGRRRSIGSGDVNAYLRSISGEDFTAKDFRTWAGTTFVGAMLMACPEPASVKLANREVLKAIDAAAERLGNTRAVCRSAYVHPAILDAFMEGKLVQRLPASLTRAAGGETCAPQRPRRGHALDPLEQATLRVLREAARSPKALAKNQSTGTAA